MLNTIYLTYLRGAMDNAFLLHVQSLGFDSCSVRLFSFFRSRFVTYRKRFVASIYQEITSHLIVYLKKLERTS